MNFERIGGSNFEPWFSTGGNRQIKIADGCAGYYYSAQSVLSERSGDQQLGWSANMLTSVRKRLEDAATLSAHVLACLSEFERLAFAEIRSVDVRSAVEHFLANAAPLEFFTAPASATGRHHPEWQVTQCGILLNTVECCIAIDRKLRTYPQMMGADGNPLPNSRDIVYAATILSDTFKPEDFNHKWDEWRHHQLAADAWRPIAVRHSVDSKIAEAVEHAIRWHLGRFTPGWQAGKDPRDLPLESYITHVLDMDFSNRDLGKVFQRKIPAY